MVAAIVIAVTGLTAADAIASAVIGLMILPRTWSLLLRAEGVADIRDLRAWTITSGLPVVSAHVVLEPDAVPAAVLDELCRCLSGDFDVEHSTLQLETTDRRRIEEATHA